MDFVFVLDGSNSINGTDFKLMKDFVSHLVRRLDIGGDARVGVVTFSSNVDTTIHLNAATSVASLQSMISSLAQSEGPTNTAAALAHVRTNMLTSAAGDRSDASDVVVVLTDGKSTNATATQVIIKFLACFLSERYVTTYRPKI